MLTRRDDRGFTLTELLVSITILGVIIGAISGVLLNVLKVNAATDDRLDATRSEQFAAVYFARDVEGMKPTGGLATSGAAQCGTPASFLFEIRGETYDPAAVMSARKTAATYVVESTTVDGAPARQIRRLWCEAGTGVADPMTPISEEIIVRNLKDVAPAAPTPDGRQLSLTLTRLDGTTFTLVANRRST